MAEPTGPATTLEDLTQTEDVVAPQDTTIVRADDATPAPSEHPLTAPMRVALDGSLALFVVVVGAPALIVVWAAVVCGGLALAGLGLTHAGALEPTTLPVAAAIGSTIAFLASTSRTARCSSSSVRRPGRARTSASPTAGSGAYSTAGSWAASCCSCCLRARLTVYLLTGNTIAVSRWRPPRPGPASRRSRRPPQGLL
jgi:hypothetical protein